MGADNTQSRWRPLPGGGSRELVGAVLGLTARLAMIIASCSAASAAAAPVMGVLAGYSTGTLQGNVSESIKGFTAQGLFGYSFRGLNAHAFFQHTDLAYRHKNDEYKGIYTLSGLGVGYTGLQSRLGKVSILAQKPLSGSYTTVSESTGTVNGRNYIYSTLTTLSGGDAFNLMGGIEFLSAGKSGQLSGSKEKVFLGLYAGYLRHAFAKQLTRIKTNNSVLAPISPGSRGTTSTVTLMSLFFTIHYNF